MVKLITIKKDGKITLPMDVRKEIKLTGDDQYLLVYGDREILLKRVEKPNPNEKMKELLKEFRTAFKKAGITQKDIEEEVKAARKQKGA